PNVDKYANLTKIIVPHKTTIFAGDMCRFSHLQVHTQYSLLDSAASIDNLYKKAAADHMPALAITDHGNMFGAFEFVSQAWK
ncbi:PHP domain-containing protein, partial [Acinetobacter baumannii]